MTQASWALNAEFWEEHETLRLSDFWFDECLIYARAALPAEKLQEFEAAWHEGRKSITPPKLLVVLDTIVESVIDAADLLDLSEEQPWRRAADIDRTEGYRQAILDRANQPGQGPVLRLLAADMALAVTETVAAIQAMQSE